LKTKVPILGDLEAEVMGILWETAPMSVKDVALRLERTRAYNTVQTTLDRLHRKRLLRRDKQSHAFMYEPLMSNADYHREILSSVVADLLPQSREPVLATFVELAADADMENLERLEKLIQAKRKREHRK
jgi:predicted transcriptional regulator